MSSSTSQEAARTISLLRGRRKTEECTRRNAWRSDFDLDAQGRHRLAVAARPRQRRLRANNFGTSSWYAGAVYARVRSHQMALRDRSRRSLLGAVPPTPREPGAEFLGWRQLGDELTASVEVKPTGPLAGFVEYQKINTRAPLYFRGAWSRLGTPVVPFSSQQQDPGTDTVGATTWF